MVAGYKMGGLHPSAVFVKWIGRIHEFKWFKLLDKDVFFVNINRMSADAVKFAKTIHTNAYIVNEPVNFSVTSGVFVVFFDSSEH